MIFNGQLNFVEHGGHCFDGSGFGVFVDSEEECNEDSFGC